jgi:hypothetical protein
LIWYCSQFNSKGLNKDTQPEPNLLAMFYELWNCDIYYLLLVCEGWLWTGIPKETSWDMSMAALEERLRQEKVKKFEDFVDRRLKPDLVNAIAQRDNLFQQQKTL